MKQPKIGKDVFLASDCDVVGDVSIDDECAIFYHAVIRGDENEITIGKKTNIQDNAVLHASLGYPEYIGSGVTIGHGAIVHGAVIGDNTLIGMGAIVLNGAHIGRECLIGAGSLVTTHMEIPDHMLVYGSPAKIIRPLREEEISEIYHNCEVYQKLRKEYL